MRGLAAEELLGASGQDCPLAVPVRWGPPLPPPLRLTGTFGEHRSGHLHAGVDLSTGGVAGMPVLAVADGSIVRLRAGGLGYGRALYLQTDAGPLAVYGHLERFAAGLEAELRRRQRALGEFEIDFGLEAGRFRCTRGDTIAVSGATGAGPPHLHFELRSGIHPLNPLDCGLAVPDLGSPEIGPLALHALSPDAWVADGWRTVLTSPPGAAPSVWGPLGVEAYVVDYAGTTGARLTPQAVRLFVDGVRVFERRFAQIDFARDAEVGRIYGQLARQQGPFALRLYRWPPGAEADQTECDHLAGVIATQGLDPGPHVLCLEVGEAGGYCSEASWPIDVRPPLVPTAWQATQLAESTWQLALHVAAPLDTTRLPLRLRVAGPGEVGSGPGRARDAGEWVQLGSGWFAAPLVAPDVSAVRVTDAAGRSVVGWVTLEADRPVTRAVPDTRKRLSTLRIEVAEGLAAIDVRLDSPPPGLPDAALQLADGRRQDLARRGSPDHETWSFALAPGEFAGRSVALMLSAGDPPRSWSRCLALPDLVGFPGAAAESTLVSCAGGALTLSSGPASFYGPTTLRVRAVWQGDAEWSQWVDPDHTVRWQAAGPPAARLAIRGPLLEVAPAWWPLQSALRLEVDRRVLSAGRSDGKPEDVPATSPAWGLCRRDADGDWSWIGGTLGAGGLVAELSELGWFAVLVDDRPPACRDPLPPDGARISMPPGRLAVGVDEIGSGFDPRAADLLLDGAMLLATWDIDERILWAALDAPLAPGEHFWEAVITDRAGNRVRQRYGFMLAER